MNAESPVLSPNERTRPRRRTVVPTTDRHWVRSNIPNTPLSNFVQVYTNGYMRRTVVSRTVRPAQPFWLSETLFLRVSIYFSMCPQTDNYDGPSYPRRTVVPTTDRHTHDSPSCITVMTVRDPSLKGLHTFSKCSLTDNYDGPSYSRRSVQHNRHNGQRPLS